jgi:hypothetical protein
VQISTKLQRHDPQTPTSTEAMMVFDHIGFNVTDFAKTKDFLTKALAPLGIGITGEGP